jgi:hypothetical protein
MSKKERIFKSKNESKNLIFNPKEPNKNCNSQLPPNN